MEKPPQYVDIHIRLPEMLHLRLVIAARRDSRSLNNLMVKLLRDGLGPEPDPGDETRMDWPKPGSTSS